MSEEPAKERLMEERERLPRMSRDTVTFTFSRKQEGVM